MNDPRLVRPRVWAGTLFAGLMLALSLNGTPGWSNPPGQPSSTTPVQPVSSLDLAQYMGTWYEIASVPMFFQRSCALNTQATYSLLKNGEVKVLNQCHKDNLKVIKATGRAKAVSTQPNQPKLGAGKAPGTFKVSFLGVPGLRWLASGDYWILDLASDYRYAVIGHPTRKYGWILSRTQTLSNSDMQTIETHLKAQGYDLCQFQMTRQQPFNTPYIPVDPSQKRLCDIKH